MKWLIDKLKFRLFMGLSPKILEHYHTEMVRVLDRINSFEHNTHQELEQIKDNINNSFNDFNHKIIAHQAQLLQNTNRLLCLLKRNSHGTIRVVFLVHAPEFWYALEPIYKQMLGKKDIFDPIILTIEGDLLGKHKSNTATSYFRENNIDYLDCDKLSKSLEFNHVLDLINPDVVFKQVPWESQYTKDYQTKSLIGYKICYIPYGIHTNPKEDLLYNDDIHHMGWRLYCVNEDHRMHYKQYNALRDINCVISGYTKFEYIHNKLVDQNICKPWPINSSKKNRLKILWCPHHSLPDWLGFCTFHSNYLEILNFAKKNSDIDIVFRPHPALFEVMVIRNKMTQQQIDDFIACFTNLPNCFLDLEADYMYLFKHSDILITDGVGFLFEYLITKKPIIHVDSGVSCGFNRFYSQFEKSWYKASNIDQVEIIVNELINNKDILKQARDEMSLLLYDYNTIDTPSNIICSDLINSILGMN